MQREKVEAWVKRRKMKRKENWEKRKERARNKRKVRKKEERKTEVEFILTILLLNNKNKMW
jgi:hypothetical protein